MSLGIQNNYYSESSMVSAIRKQEAGNVKENFTKQLYFVILCITMLKIYSIMIAYTQTVVKARLERYSKKSFMPNWKGYQRIEQLSI